MLLDWLLKDGFVPKRKTFTEYSSSCPACGGSDRFLIWPDSGRYWCRQCQIKGDLIQYLRDFHHMPYGKAADIAGKPISVDLVRKARPHRQVAQNRASTQHQRSQQWSESTRRIIAGAHINLMKNNATLDWLRLERGISQKTAQQFHLGWLNKDYWFDKKHFGLESDNKKIFLPSGLVIPWKDTRIRIRRDNPGSHGRYHLLKGSETGAFTTGSAYENTAIIVESELDGILLSQAIYREIFIVALGSAQAKPDDELLARLNYSTIVLIALDTDGAGAKSSKWWLDGLPNAFRTLTPKVYGKDLSEAFLHGLDLNDWLSASLLMCAEQLGG